jgi:hypothetical protein
MLSFGNAGNSARAGAQINAINKMGTKGRQGIGNHPSLTI